MFSTKMRKLYTAYKGNGKIQVNVTEAKKKKFVATAVLCIKTGGEWYLMKLHLNTHIGSAYVAS